MMAEYKLSIVVACYNMQRELPRTLQTLLPDYQEGVERSDYEIVVVDNGSTPRQVVAQHFHEAANIRLISIDNPSISPVGVINDAVNNCNATYVAVLIDGARMVTPRFIRQSLSALDGHVNAVVSALAYHLGPGPQSKTVTEGYCQEVEDKLMASVDWRADGYSLFEISELASSSGAGVFEPISECNTLLLRKDLWDRFKGFDERFVSAGGGLANLDLFKRLSEDEKTSIFVLAGEGSFHQFHGGVSTNQPGGRFAEFELEYIEIRAEKFIKPVYEPFIYGGIDKRALRFIEYSAKYSLTAGADAVGKSVNDDAQIDNKQLAIYLGLISNEVTSSIISFEHRKNNDLQTLVRQRNHHILSTFEFSAFHTVCVDSSESIGELLDKYPKASLLTDIQGVSGECVYDPLLNRTAEYWHDVFGETFTDPSLNLVISNPHSFAEKNHKAMGLGKDEALVFWFFSYMDAERWSRQRGRSCIKDDTSVDISNEDIYTRFYSALLMLIDSDDENSWSVLDQIYREMLGFRLILKGSNKILRGVIEYKNKMVTEQHLINEGLVVQVDRLEGSELRYNHGVLYRLAAIAKNVLYKLRAKFRSYL